MKLESELEKMTVEKNKLEDREGEVNSMHAKLSEENESLKK